MSFSAHPAYSFCLRQFVVRVARSQLFAVVVALLPRRRPVLLAIVGVVIRVRPVGSSVVDRFVDRFAAHRLLAPFCLSEGGEAWRGGFSPVPCGLLLGVSLSCPSSFSRDGGASRLVRLFACRFGILRVMALSLAWRVVAAFPPSPVARAVCLCGQGYPSGLPFLRLVSSFASPPMCLLGGVRRSWASRACVSLSFDTNIAPSLLSWGRGDISFLVGSFGCSANRRGMRAYNRS